MPAESVLLENLGAFSFGGLLKNIMTLVVSLCVLGVIAAVHVERVTSTGPSCKTSCDGLPDGDYQSCNACNVYASCWGGGRFLDNRPCAEDYLMWDDNTKRCEWTSDTCSQRGSDDRCITSCDGLPDGDYQSCNACNVYASCWGGGNFLDNRPCAEDYLWWDDDLKRCEWTSNTCFISEPEPCTSISTPNAYRYINIGDIDGSTPLTFTFEVQTCNDVHVGLYGNSPNGRPNGTPMYEIVIGGWGNTKSVIRTQKQQKPAAVTNSRNKRVSCSESRDFWITYDDGSIQVGEGSVVGSDQFMEFDDPNPQDGIVNLGISTGWGATGEWCYRLQ